MFHADGQSAPLYRHWGSVQAVRPIGGLEVWLYPFMTSALEGDEGSASRPGRSLPPGKTRYPVYRRLGGPQGRSGQVRKISRPPGFDPRTVQPVASRYTDYATRSIKRTDRHEENKSLFAILRKRLKTDDGRTCIPPTFSIKWNVRTK
jgi:hypothetical protein